MVLLAEIPSCRPHALCICLPHRFRKIALFFGGKPMQARLGWIPILALACVFLLPSLALAQGQIVGQVKDESGAILPGVTVEAASPALIEKVKTGVTDDQGRYRIVDLRPGTYKLTFTLTGFSTLTR